MPEYIYSIAEAGIYVNLFAVSQVKYAVHKDSMQLNMTTKFPYDPKVQLSVGASKSLQAKIRIRIPSWAAKQMTVYVNGKKTITGSPGTYVNLSREWKNGDVISFDLPMNFKATRYEGSEKNYNDGQHYVLECGPIMMAALNVGNPQKVISIHANAEKLVKNMKSIPGKLLCFSIEGNKDLRYSPYFEIQDEPFSCYPLISTK